jgi:hypothetical protein
MMDWRMIQWGLVLGSSEKWNNGQWSGWGRLGAGMKQLGPRVDKSEIKSAYRDRVDDEWGLTGDKVNGAIVRNS